MEKVIEINGLKKRYGEVSALDGISFSVNRGELFAFLGANGAGKSTTINIMCAVLSKDAGRVKINGVDIDEDKNSIKRNIGVVFQSSALDSALSVYDNLECRAALYGIYGEDFKARLSHLSNTLGFSEFLTRSVGKLSGGQRRKIDIARALIHSPKILILDEPTTGLDPQTRKTLWSVIDELRKSENITVFLTTHYMEEASDADYVVILDNGKIAAEGSALELKNKYTGDFITLYGVSEADVKAISQNYSKVALGYRIFVSNTKEATELIVKNPAVFCDYEITKGRMDDVFLAVTGKTLKGGVEK